MEKSQPNLLAVETSSPILSVAWQRRGGKISEYTVRGMFEHAENLMPMIDRSLRQSRLKPRDLGAFLIGRGPGSFTGLRVGFATLKGFLALKRKPCYGASSLDLIAARIPCREDWGLCVCLNARREKVYARFYQCRRKEWSPQGRILTLSLPELLKRLPRKLLIAGDALNRYAPEFRDFARNPNYDLRFLSEKYWYPRASTMIRKFPCRKLKKTAILQRLQNPGDFIPLYFRHPTEEKRRPRAKAR